MESNGIFNLALAAAILVWCPLILGQFERRLNPQEAVLHWALRVTGLLAVVSVYLPVGDPVAVMTILPWTATGLALGGLGLQKLWRWGLSGNANALFGWACLFLAMSAVELARNRVGRTDFANAIHLLYGGFLFIAIYSLILVQLEKAEGRAARRLYTVLFLYLLSEIGYYLLRGVWPLGHDVMALAVVISSLGVVLVVIGARAHLVKSSLGEGLLAVATISGVVANGFVLASQLGIGPFQGFDRLLMTHGILTIFAWIPAMGFFVMINKYYCRDHRSTVPWSQVPSESGSLPALVGLHLGNLARSDFETSDHLWAASYRAEGPIKVNFTSRFFSGVAAWTRSQSIASSILNLLEEVPPGERLSLATFQNGGVGYLQIAWQIPGGNLHLILLPNQLADDGSQIVFTTFDGGRSFGDQGIYWRGWFPAWRLPLDCQVQLHKLHGQLAVTIEVFLFGGLVQSFSAKLTSK